MCFWHTRKRVSGLSSTSGAIDYRSRLARLDIKTEFTCLQRYTANCTWATFTFKGSRYNARTGELHFRKLLLDRRNCLLKLFMRKSICIWSICMYVYMCAMCYSVVFRNQSCSGTRKYIRVNIIRNSSRHKFDIAFPEMITALLNLHLQLD